MISEVVDVPAGTIRDLADDVTAYLVEKDRVVEFRFRADAEPADTETATE